MREFTAYLVVCRFRREVTFQWLFWSGLLVLLVGLIGVGHIEPSEPRAWEYSYSGLEDFTALSRCMVVAADILAGLGFMTLATVQDQITSGRGRRRGR